MKSMPWWRGLLIGSGMLPIAVNLIPLAEGAEIAVRIDGGKDVPAPFILPGSTPEIVLRNNDAKLVDVELFFSLSDFSALEGKFSRRVVVPAGGEARVPLTTNGRLGIHYVDFELTGVGHTEVGRRSFVSGVPIGPGQDPTGFRFGVAGHPERGSSGERVREFDAASLVGINVMRIDALWQRLEPSPAAWSWGALDELMDLSAARKMELQVILGYGTKDAARPSPQQKVQVERLEAAGRHDEAWWLLARTAQDDFFWRRFIASIAAHCLGRVHLWEVWNEPDLTGFFLGSTEDYLRMLRSAHQELKRVDDGNRVMTGGFAGVGRGERFNADLQERVLAEGGDAFDIHAFHGHGPFSYFQPTIDGELDRMRAGMKKPHPLYFNETALTSAKFGERAQAVALVKKSAFGRARGAIGYTWYDIRNDGSDPENDEHNYGLLNRDFQPKAVYAAYNELVRRLRGCSPLGELALGRGRNGYVFAGNGQRVAVIWNEKPNLPDVPLAIRASGCTGGQLIDLMGNGTSLPAISETVLVNINDTPAYLVLPGGESMPEVLGSLVTANDALAVPGMPLDVIAHVLNPLTVAIVMDLSWDSTRDGHQAQQLALAAGTSIDVKIHTTCPATTLPGAPARQSIDYAIRETPWSGIATLAIHALQRIPATGNWTRSPDFTLSGIGSVVNFFEADPSQTSMTWHGDADLSAKVWLARAERELLLHVEVRDDIHHQVETAENAWRGDGLQLAFQGLNEHDYWELGVAQSDDGKPFASLWMAPREAQAHLEDIAVQCAPSGDGVTYDIRLPYARFGLSDAMLEHGMRFNLIVNDNDGTLRKGFIQIAKGIGDSKDTNAFPIISFERKEP